MSAKKPLVLNTNGQYELLQAGDTLDATVNGGLVYSNTSFTDAVANTTTRTAFASQRIIYSTDPIVVGSVISIELAGFYSTVATPPNITVDLEIGGVIYNTSGVINGMTTVTNAGWTAYATLVVASIGSGGTVNSQAYGELATAPTTSLSINMPNTGTKTLNTTVNNTIKVFVTWSAASASNTITLCTMCVYINNLSSLSNGIQNVFSDYSPTYTGVSVAPSGGVNRHCLQDKLCTVYVAPTSNGTSNSTAFTITLPFNAKNLAIVSLGFCTDNGSITIGGYGATAANSNVLTLNKQNGSSWTGSGAKRVVFTIQYEVA